MDNDALALAMRSIVQFLYGNQEKGRRLANEAAIVDYLNPVSHFKVREMIPQKTVESLYQMVS